MIQCSKRFIAIDFETANFERNSACSIGIVLVENQIINEEFYSLIKPPMKNFKFTDLHGITWGDVKNEKTFKELWPDILKYFNNIDFVVAHNVIFDKGIFEACCSYYGIEKPKVKFKCTCQIARKKLNLKSNALDKVSAYFGIDLKHHNALSDARACAKIMLKFLS